MRDSIRNDINKYPTAEYLLKHKDAVKLCVDFLINWGNKDLTHEDIKYICSEFEKKCYVRSNTWIEKEEK